MDNDLMARRLRPPSEPLRPPLSNGGPGASSRSTGGAIPVTAGSVPSSAMVTAPPSQGAPNFSSAPIFAAPASDPLSEPEFAEAAAPWEMRTSNAATWDAPEADPAPWDTPEVDTAPWDVPQASAAPWDVAQTDVDAPVSIESQSVDAPWDRPDETAGLTDMSAADQPAWDRPSADEWEPSAAFATETADQTVVDQAVADPVVGDPYDAFAPVIGDLSSPAYSWSEMNRPDAARNAPMAETSVEAGELVAAEASATDESIGAEPDWFASSDWTALPKPDEDAVEPGAAPEAQLTFDAVTEGVFEARTHAGSLEVQPESLWKEAAASSDPEASAVAPATYEERGFGPTPPDDLFQDAEAPSEDVASTEESAPTGEETSSEDIEAAPVEATAPDEAAPWDAASTTDDGPFAAEEHEPGAESVAEAMPETTEDEAEPEQGAADAMTASNNESAPDPETLETTDQAPEPAESEAYEPTPALEPFATFTTTPGPDGTPNIVVRIELAIVGDAKNPAIPAGRHAARQPDFDPRAAIPASTATPTVEQAIESPS